MAHRREAKLFREQAAHRRVARPERDPLQIALVDNFYQRPELLFSDSRQASRFESKIVVRTNAFIDDVVSTVTAKLENLQTTIDEIVNIGRARPNIVDGANTLARAEIVVHRTKKAVLALTVNPRSADDIALRASSAHRFFGGNLGPAVEIDRPRLVSDRVRRASDDFAVEGILCAELNHLGAKLSRRVGEKPRSFHVHGRSFGGIPLSFVDLNHRAINQQRRPHLGNASLDRRLIGDVEILSCQSEHIMIGAKSTREMAADQTGCAGDEDFHELECRTRAYGLQERRRNLQIIGRGDARSGLNS
jgi:hypothetical protein